MSAFVCVQGVGGVSWRDRGCNPSPHTRCPSFERRLSVLKSEELGVNAKFPIWEKNIYVKSLCDLVAPKTRQPP